MHFSKAVLLLTAFAASALASPSPAQSLAEELLAKTGGITCKNKGPLNKTMTGQKGALCNPKKSKGTMTASECYKTKKGGNYWCDMGATFKCELISEVVGPKPKAMAAPTGEVQGGECFL